MPGRPDIITVSPQMADKIRRQTREVLAYDNWASNAELIADAASLGYIYGRVLDCTYGQGTFWKKWQPDVLVAADITGTGVGSDPLIWPSDFTRMIWDDRSFDCVVYDPPYKLNGTPDPQTDTRYGTQTPTRWQDRMQLIHDGLRECARVLGDGYLLIKCQDQVSSGKVRWQSYSVTKWAEELGLGLVDRFDMLGGRPQPAGRSQQHARRNASQLLVFRRGHTWTT